ncbi:unnamed protein product [Echinostoma caproni]|uniref:SHSP domain-containing protein n=1 Tax=Echinostoma caproni TaxID=27848 RepID=A0A183AGI8_9TREM|nr:unnamed protein product [Echinostoma caproni]
MESIISTAVLRSICPQAKIGPTSVQILGVTGHKLPLMGEIALMVDCTAIRLILICFLIPENSPSIPSLTATHALNYSVSLHTSLWPNVHTPSQRLVVKFYHNTPDMNVEPAKSEVDGEPIFMKRRVIPYDQREDLLKTTEKMERDGIITRVTSSV